MDDWRGVVALDQIKVSNTIRFVNAPALGLEKTDAITAIALVMKF